MRTGQKPMLSVDWRIWTAVLLIFSPLGILAKEPAQGTKAENRRGAVGYRAYYEFYGEEKPGRFRIHSTTPGGPADKAGLQEGDLIIAFNGVGFRFADELERLEAFDWISIGDTVELTVLRDAKTLILELIAGEMREDLFQELEELKNQHRYSRQASLLQHLGRGEGAVVNVSHDASTHELRFSSAGQPEKSFQYMDAFLATMPPLVDLFNRLKPGDRCGLGLKMTGNRMDIEILDLPPYLADFKLSEDP